MTFINMLKCFSPKIKIKIILKMLKLWGMTLIVYKI